MGKKANRSKKREQRKPRFRFSARRFGPTWGVWDHLYDRQATPPVHQSWAAAEKVATRLNQMAWEAEAATAAEHLRRAGEEIRRPRG